MFKLLLVGLKVRYLPGRFTIHDSRFTISQEFFHAFNRSTQDCPIASLNNWSLNQIRILNHQRNDLSIGELTFRESELFVNRLAGSQKIAW
jgi:hypothetical protein